MNIQIFGGGKNFDVKKAERYFKERRIPVQRVDLFEKGLSKGGTSRRVSGTRQCGSFGRPRREGKGDRYLVSAHAGRGQGAIPARASRDYAAAHRA